MTRLIVDHFRRWSWLLWLVAALAFGLGWYICALGGRSFAFWVLLLTMWMGANLLSFDLKHGLVRTLLALPLTARQIGRAWWLATVGIPALAITALLFCGAALWSHSHPGEAWPMSGLATAALFSLLWLGNGFSSIYGMTNEIFGNRRERFNIVAISLLSMVMLFGSMLFATRLFEQPTLFTFFLAIGLIVTVASWVRAERFVLGRAGFRLPAVPPKKLLPAEHRPPPGRGGIPFLIGTCFSRGFLYLTAMVALLSLLSLRRDAGLPVDPGMIMLAQMGSLMSFWFIVLYHAMPALRQLRLWRTLPISATRLAAVIIALAILPLAAVGAVSAGAAALAWGPAAAIATLKSYAFIIAPAALCMFLAAWLGTGRGVYVLLFLIITGWGMARPMLETRFFFRKIPLELSGTLVAVCVLLGFLLTRLVLVRGSWSYRVSGTQENPLGN